MLGEAGKDSVMVGSIVNFPLSIAYEDRKTQQAHGVKDRNAPWRVDLESGDV